MQGHPAYNLVLVALCVLVGVVIIRVADRPDPPSKHRLEQYTGTVEWIEVKRGRRGPSVVHFRLSGDPRTFHYRSMSGSIRYVAETLQSVGTLPVTVSTLQSTPRGQNTAVWELSIDGKVVRSNEAIIRSWQRDDLFGQSFGALFLVVAVVQGYLAIKKLNAPQPGAPADGPRPAGSGSPRFARRG